MGDDRIAEAQTKDRREDINQGSFVILALFAVDSLKFPSSLVAPGKGGEKCSGGL
jgi:hypothetical protein